MDFCFDCSKIENAYHSGIGLYVLIYLTIFIFFLRKRSKEMQTIASLFLIALFVGLDLTIFPIPKGWPQIISGQKPIVNFEFMRFMREIILYKSWRVMKLTVLNVLLFVPIGILLQAVQRKPKLWRTVFLSFLTSLGIEVMQYITSFFFNGFRIFDVDDLFLNTVGGLLGAIIWFVIAKTTKFKLKAHKSSPLFIAGLVSVSLLLIFCLSYLASNLVY